ncbi:MAG: fibronectin type III domain-containing protein [Nanoarchaeota archaeon]
MLDSNYSNVSCTTTPDIQLAAPTNLVATMISSTQINLNWTSNSSSQESGFAIERGPQVSGTFTSLTGVAKNVTSHSDITVAANTQYCYRVKAKA